MSRPLHVAVVAALLFIAVAHARAADPVVPAIQGKSDSSGVLPPHVRPSGSPFRTMSWSDNKGDNIAVFSTTSKSKTAKGDKKSESKSIFVDVFSGKNGAFHKVRTVREDVKGCAADVMNEFLDTSVAVTDLDGNGIGELTFAYRSSCRSEMTPATFVVMVLEAQKQWSLRGTTRLHPARDKTEGGDFSADFKTAPAPFLERATKVWNRFVDE